MSTFLFHETIFGPVHSRRLGASLGINLLSENCKYCTFNCIYCECGWTENKDITSSSFHSCREISSQLEKILTGHRHNNVIIDNITFAGNGEPTLHPEFPEIVEETVRLRNAYYPESKIALLSNATLLYNKRIMDALTKIELNIQKLDSGSEEMFLLINNPIIDIKFSDIINQLTMFQGKVIIQTLFLRGEFMGKQIDNTSKSEVSLWLNHISKIKPSLVMLYPIARSTTAKSLQKIPVDDLNLIAAKVREQGIKAQVYT